LILILILNLMLMLWGRGLKRGGEGSFMYRGCKGKGKENGNERGRGVL
jgi:hypothetical protein